MHRPRVGVCTAREREQEAPGRRRKGSSHKSTGVEISIPSAANICVQQDQHLCASTNRQQNRHCIHQSEGRTHSKPLSDMACNLWSWCLKRNITVQAEHIAGVENTRVDLESRVFQDPCDWMLSRRVFFTGFKPSGGRWM